MEIFLQELRTGGVWLPNRPIRWRLEAVRSVAGAVLTYLVTPVVSPSDIQANFSTHSVVKSYDV